MPRSISILHGDSAAGLFRQAMQPTREDLLIHRDVLTCGPLPPISSLDSWIKLRNDFWHSVSDEFPTFEQGLLENAQTLREVDSVAVWLGTSASDQLVLAWLVQLLKLVGSRAKISLVQFTRVGDNNMEVLGLGLLKPDRIKLHPPAELLIGDTIAELERGWVAATSPDPRSLWTFLAEQSIHLPHFRESLRVFTPRYPDRNTGLGRWDWELLCSVKERGRVKAARIVGDTMDRNFDADITGDEYLFFRLRNLGDPHLPHPLVTLTGNPKKMRECDVSLTEAGEAILAGRANAIELNGIDDWVLGVHLDSKNGSVWYREDRALIRQ